MAINKALAVLIAQLDKMNPASRDAKLGTKLDQLITAHNSLQASYNILVAKLNADAGVTDTNYAASPASATVPPIGQ